jgi:hypothetical protein
VSPNRPGDVPFCSYKQCLLVPPVAPGFSAGAASIFSTGCATAPSTSAHAAGSAKPRFVAGGPVSCFTRTARAAATRGSPAAASSTRWTGCIAGPGASYSACWGRRSTTAGPAACSTSISVTTHPSLGQARGETGSAPVAHLSDSPAFASAIGLRVWGRAAVPGQLAEYGCARTRNQGSQVSATSSPATPWPGLRSNSIERCPAGGTAHTVLGRGTFRRPQPAKKGSSEK